MQFIHDAINNISNDETWFSDPKNVTSLPYPSVRRPRNGGLRLERKEDTFFIYPYMGRTYFAEMFDHYKTYNNVGAESKSRLVLYGAKGCGKATCLATLACLLTRLGRHVIYIPYCGVLAGNFVNAMKEALYFAIPPELHSAVTAAKDAAQIIELVGDFKKDYFVFILSRWDILFPDPDTGNSDLGSTEAMERIVEMTRNHYSIYSAKASARAAHYFKEHNTEQDILQFEGGLSEVSACCLFANASPDLQKVEMVQWWRHYSEKLPSDVPEDGKAHIEFTTGRMPLFLDKFLRSPGSKFSEIVKKYLSDDYLLDIRFQVRNETLRRVGNLNAEKLQMYVETIGVGNVNFLIIPFSIRFYDHMKACIQEAALVPPPEMGEELYDPQFFSCKNETGKCLTGEVCEIVTSVLQTHRPTFMRDGSWIDTARRISNPFSRNFLLKHICMNRIASGGLKLPDDRLDSMDFCYFEALPDWSKLTFRRYPDQREGRYLFIATQFLRVGIDGVASYLDRERKLIDLYFIQVGYTPKARSVDEDFFRQHYNVLRQSLTRNQGASRCTIRTSYLHIGYRNAPVLSTPVQRRVTGEEFDVEYKFYDIPLTTLDTRLEHM